MNAQEPKISTILLLIDNFIGLALLHEQWQLITIDKHDDLQIYERFS